MVRAQPDARDRLHDDAAAQKLARSFQSLGLRGGATQVISVSQIHGNYVTYAWAFPTARAAQAALRAATRQGGVRDDLFWVRGKLLLQVGGYGPPGIPLLQSRQELVARKLDARASALR